MIWFSKKFRRFRINIGLHMVGGSGFKGSEFGRWLLASGERPPCRDLSEVVESMTQNQQQAASDQQPLARRLIYRCYFQFTA